MIGDDFRCFACGENVFQTRASRKGEGWRCLPCGGGSFGEVSGQGISFSDKKRYREMAGGGDH
ncbi:MAG: hypothetical protein A2Z34_10505 [Planctomycetes bacterium RBG_16_59_8]|nr:MAG: hypothetical protein A2Z34_10505 [Planctomycetes bacterium RBG_16_59_8]